jgi:phosphotransferase system HPr-like phosphotransfer protein
LDNKLGLLSKFSKLALIALDDEANDLAESAMNEIINAREKGIDLSKVPVLKQPAMKSMYARLASVFIKTAKSFNADIANLSKSRIQALKGIATAVDANDTESIKVIDAQVNAAYKKRVAVVGKTRVSDLTRELIDLIVHTSEDDFDTLPIKNQSPDELAARAAAKDVSQFEQDVAKDIVNSPSVPSIIDFSVDESDGSVKYVTSSTTNNSSGITPIDMIVPEIQTTQPGHEPGVPELQFEMEAPLDLNDPHILIRQFHDYSNNRWNSHFCHYYRICIICGSIYIQ